MTTDHTTTEHDAAAGDPDRHRRAAEAFSGHRFRDTYDLLHPDVVWVAVGAGDTVGKDAVVAVCENTLAELGDATIEVTRHISVSDPRTAVVDTVSHYTDHVGETSSVASCDIYEFRDDLISRITSYTVEVDSPAAGH
jgi:ketosteroid isomerase-like protein